MLALGCSFGSQQPDTKEAIRLEGKLIEDEDLSGAAIAGDLLLIGSDEGATLQAFRRVESGHYRVLSEIPLLPAGSKEMDIEAVAVAGDLVHVAGSHAWVRKKVDYPENDDRLTQAANRLELSEIKSEASRDRIVRFRIDANGERRSEIETVELRPLLASDPYLGRFLEIPAKEGGIDLEGLAVEGETLYAGFRGPVLRQNYVPVMRFTFEQPEQYELLFVNLDGNGIRDLLKVEGGMLVVAGPVGDGDGEFELYFWDGQDCVPGTDKAPAKLERLDKIKPPKGGKPEAMALLGETAEAWTLLVLFDGAEGGAPRQIVVEKP